MLDRNCCSRNLSYLLYENHVLLFNLQWLYSNLTSVRHWLDLQGVESDAPEYAPVRSPLSEWLPACHARPGSPSDCRLAHDQSPMSPAGRQEEVVIELWSSLRWQKWLQRKGRCRERERQRVFRRNWTAAESQGWPYTTWVIVPKHKFVYDRPLTIEHKSAVLSGFISVVWLFVLLLHAQVKMVT